MSSTVPCFSLYHLFLSTFGSFGPFSTPDTSRPSTASKTAPSSMGRCLKRPGGASVGPAVAFSGVSWMENLIEAQSLPDWEADGRDQDLEHKDVVFLRHAKNDLRSFWIIKTMQNLLYCTSLAIHGAVRHRDIDLGASTPEWEACSPGFDRLRDGKTADQSQNDTDRGVPPT